MHILRLTLCIYQVPSSQRLDHLYISLTEALIAPKFTHLKQHWLPQTTISLTNPQQLGQHIRFWYLSHCQAMKTQTSLHKVQAYQSFRCSHTQSLDQDEDSNQNLDL